MRMVGIAALLAAIGCTTVAAQEEISDGRCDTAPLADLVGRAGSADLGREALRRSGAGALRWIRPGDSVTMDYRTDRLNIHLLADGRVEGFDCG